MEIEDMIAEHVQRERDNMRSRPRLPWMDALVIFAIVVAAASFIIRAFHG